MTYSDDRNRDRRNPRQGSRPASPEEVEDAVSLVLEGFGGRAANADKFKAYAFALEGLPVESIARGVRKILRGEAGLDPNFPPTAPQLAKACKPVTFLSPGWIPLENTREPEQIEKPRSHLSGIVGGALKKFPTEEEDK